jgi:hypothetical protein
MLNAFYSIFGKNQLEFMTKVNINKRYNVNIGIIKGEMIEGIQVNNGNISKLLSYKNVGNKKLLYIFENDIILRFYIGREDDGNTYVEENMRENNYCIHLFSLNDVLDIKYNITNIILNDIKQSLYIYKNQEHIWGFFNNILSYIEDESNIDLVVNNIPFA